MAGQCDECSLTEWEAIQQFYMDETKAVEFFRSHGVLPSTVHCPICMSECVYYGNSHKWRCHKTITRNKKKKRRCDYSVSDYKGTILSQSKFPSWKFLLFINCWLQNRSYNDVVKNTDITDNTVVNMSNLCFEVTNFYFESQEPIGEEGVVVEVGGLKLAKAKPGQGRGIEELWIFGGIERGSGKIILFPPLETHEINTLLPLIEKFIKPGSVIITEDTDTYRGLSLLGYEHKTGNDSDPKRVCDIQNVERLLRDAKSWVIKSGIRWQYFKEYIGRYAYIRNFPNSSTRLHNFLCLISSVYAQHNNVLQS